MTMSLIWQLQAMEVTPEQREVMPEDEQRDKTPRPSAPPQSSASSESSTARSTPSAPAQSSSESSTPSAPPQSSAPPLSSTARRRTASGVAAEIQGLSLTKQDLNGKNCKVVGYDRTKLRYIVEVGERVRVVDR